MARYHISNKNIYGFKDNIYQMFLLIPLVIALSLLAEFVLGPLFYNAYQKDTVLKDGMAGSEAGGEIPVAQSIADMEKFGTFTLITSGTVLKYDTVRSGENIYHRIELPSGEKVIAHINQKALLESNKVGLYRLPAGEWRVWEAPDEVMVYEEFLAVTDHYVDMYGDYAPVLSESDYGMGLGKKASAWIFIIVMTLYRVIGVRRRRFAPALFWKRDPLLPRNDLECWCASSFAIWAHSFSMLEGWPLITGVHGSRKAVANFKKVALGEQWDIKNRQDGLNTVHELVEKHAGRLDTEYPGWDLCRATQLLGMMYLVNMIDREELDLEFSAAGKVIQQKFHSWDAMAESYLAGYEAWLTRVGSANAAQSAAYRRNTFERLKANPDGPYSVPFRMDLNYNPGSGKGERNVVKRVLANYRAQNA
ncbi:MAG: DUF1266 domain-containing protein [Lachnospiraceae bacterium]|nr:DUF1266 domain-containing protein [Lachnospiraceae bacterium]